MKCIYCGSMDTKVVDSRISDETNSIRRRRECLKCGKRFNTHEMVEVVPLLVVKSNGNRQLFDSSKIKNGIIKACEKRPIAISQIDVMVDNIEKSLQNSFEQEVPAKKIGEMVMAELKKLDEIAYIRYASVYRSFKDVTSLKKFIEELK